MEIGRLLVGNLKLREREVRVEARKLGESKVI